jgi:regulator of cell morphogenesis and NO signaling
MEMVKEERQTVREIAQNSHAAARVFHNHGISFCCQGERPLVEVCEEHNLTPEGVFREIEQAESERAAISADWTQADTPELIDHIVSTHHVYLRTELPRIQTWLDRVFSKYAERDPDTIGKLPAVFGALRAELEPHLQKEEVILFPAVLRNASMPLGGPVRVMLMEHDHAQSGLEALRSITNNYTAPEHACRTYRALFDGLRELDADLRQHIYLENEVLFPRIKQ